MSPVCAGPLSGDPLVLCLDPYVLIPQCVDPILDLVFSVGIWSTLQSTTGVNRQGCDYYTRHHDVLLFVH